MKKCNLLLAALFFCGCAHTAPEQTKQTTPASKPEISAALVEKSVVKGKTTWQELVARMGPPNSVVPHPQHLPKFTKPEDLKKLEELKKTMHITPEMFAAETWNYWQINGGMRTCLVEVYLDDNRVALDYKVSTQVVKP